MQRFKLIFCRGVAIAFIFIHVGFNFSEHSIPLSEIYDGGPPKDGIPALTDPAFVEKEGAVFLKPQDRVIGVNFSGEARAYPLSILNWHELVNDVVAGQPLLVSYCPLCGTGMVFNSVLDGKRAYFGVSGKLYNSDVLFYDRDTESLWSQIKMQAVTGSLTGKKLGLIPSENTTWQAWKEKYPHTRVLSDKTGYQRDYMRDAYRGYSVSSRLMFPVTNRDDRMPLKAWVLGVMIDGKTKAFPFQELAKHATNEIEDRVAGQIIRIVFDRDAKSAVVYDASGQLMPSIQAYWFAWAAFYPDTEVFMQKEEK